MTLARQWFYVSLLGVTSLSVCLQTHAQEQPTQPPPPDIVTKVIELAHLDAYEAAHAIGELPLPVSAVGMGETKLVLSGTSKDIQRVLEDLITPLDVPTAGGSSKMITEFLPLAGIRTDDLMSALRTVTTGTPTRLAIDEINRMLVVRGTSDAIAEIKGLLAQLEKPVKSLTLHFSFIRTSIGKRDTTDLAPLPNALKPVAKTLEENGFANPSLMAPVVVVANEGQRFESESALRTVYDEQALEENLVFTVTGGARLQEDRNLVHLNVDAKIQGEYLDESEGIANGEAHFHAATTIAAKLGSYVILAAAPGSTARGDTIALVVRVTANTE